MPYKINTQFIGREAELEILNTFIRKKAAGVEAEATARLKLLETASEKEKACAIDIAVTGVSGVGKSELVLQFATKNEHRFRNIIWLCAETEDSVNNCSYKNLIKLNNTAIRDEQVNDIYFSQINEHPTLIIFDNVFINDLSQFLPTKGKYKNIIIIATSQRSDIPCDLNVVLKCLSPQNSLQYFQNNIPNENIKDLESLSEILSNLPIALEFSVQYFKHYKKIWEKKEKKFTIKDLVLEIKNEPASFLNFNYKYSCCFDEPTNLQFMLDKAVKIITKIDSNPLDLLKYISYMDNLNINYKMFQSDICYSLQFKSAGKMLQNVSLINVIDDNVIEIIPFIQTIVRGLCDKYDIIYNLLTCLKDSNEAPEKIATKIKIVINKLFCNHMIDNPYMIERFIIDINNGNCKKFLEATSVGTPSEQYDKLMQVYHIIMKTKDNDLRCYIHNTSMTLLNNLKNYQEMINLCDAFMYNSPSIDFNCSEQGLNVWHYKACALLGLKQLEKAWIICKNTFHLLMERCSTNHYEFITLKLLTEIAVEFKKNDPSSTKLDLCLDIIEHIYGTFTNWDQNLYFDHSILSLDVITNYFFEINNHDFVIKFLKNIISRIESRVEYINGDFFRADLVMYMFKLQLYKCYYNAKDYISTYNIIKDILHSYSNALILLSDIIFLAKFIGNLEVEFQLCAVKICITSIMDAVRNYVFQFEFEEEDEEEDEEQEEKGKKDEDELLQEEEQFTVCVETLDLLGNFLMTNSDTDTCKYFVNSCEYILKKASVTNTDNNYTILNNRVHIICEKVKNKL